MKQIKAVHHEGASSSNSYQRRQDKIHIEKYAGQLMFRWEVSHGWRGITSHLILVESDSMLNLAKVATEDFTQGQLMELATYIVAKMPENNLMAIAKLAESLAKIEIVMRENREKQAQRANLTVLPSQKTQGV